MDQRVKALWVEALRSGRYPQGKRRLREHGRYCPLGVLCDLAVVEGETRWEEVPPGGDRWRCGSTGNGGTPPPEVRRWAAIEGRHYQPLLLLNDAGSSFDEIADAIERTF